MFNDLVPESLPPGDKILLVVPILVPNSQSTKQRHKVLPALTDADHVFDDQLEVLQHQQPPNGVHLGYGRQQLAGVAEPAAFWIRIYN